MPRLTSTPWPPRPAMPAARRWSTSTGTGWLVDTALIHASETKSGEDNRIPMNDELRATLRDLPSRIRAGVASGQEAGRASSTSDRRRYEKSGSKSGYPPRIDVPLALTHTTRQRK